MITQDLLSRYIQTHPYGLRPSTIVQLTCTWCVYHRWCSERGHEPYQCDTVTAWIDELRESHQPDSVRTQRGNLLCILRWAYRERLLDDPMLRVRKLRPVRREPEAWTLDEVRQLLATADARSLWWSSLCRVGYDTALRLGDLLEMRVVQIKPAVLRMVQHKTVSPVRVTLRPETRERVVRQIDGVSGSDLVWPLWGRREAFYRAFRSLVAYAGIRPGTFRWLRRTAATQVEIVQPGRATELLGHASRSTTEQWYIDRSQVSDVVLPPL